MPMWTWIAIGVGSFLVAALLVTLAVARVLGTIGLEISRLQEQEFWATWEPSRTVKPLQAPASSRQEMLQALEPRRLERLD
jgi:uncharacterized membrane protein